MKHTVLFSPIGNTDPVRGNCDGPMLHILRHYRPVRALLFLSRRMEQLEKDNPRLIALARAVSPDTEVSLHCSGLEDVSVFTAFQAPFQACLRQLSEENPGCPILLNITSGTPQMNAELCIQAAVSPLDLRPIQVVTPQMGSNHDIPHIQPDASVQDILEWLLDGNPSLQKAFDMYPQPNRCREVTLTNYVREILLSSLKAQIAQGDFIGAATAACAGEVRKYFSGRAIQGLQGAAARQTFQISLARRLFDGARMPGLPVQDGPFSRLVEYYLRMRSLFLRGDYAPFVLYLSPLAQEACRQYLQRALPRLEEAIFDRPRRGSCLSLEALGRIYPKARAHLEARIAYEQEPRISLWLLLYLLDYCADLDPEHEPARGEFSWLRDIEEDLRNSIAHRLVPATQRKLEDCAGMSVNKLLGRLDRLMIRICAPRLTRDMLNSYEKMGAALSALLEAGG